MLRGLLGVVEQRKNSDLGLCWTSVGIHRRNSGHFKKHGDSGIESIIYRLPAFLSRLFTMLWCLIIMYVRIVQVPSSSDWKTTYQRCHLDLILFKN